MPIKTCVLSSEQFSSSVSFKSYIHCTLKAQALTAIPAQLFYFTLLAPPSSLLKREPAYAVPASPPLPQASFSLLPLIFRYSRFCIYTANSAEQHQIRSFSATQHLPISAKQPVVLSLNRHSLFGNCRVTSLSALARCRAFDLESLDPRLSPFFGTPITCRTILER